MSRAERQSDESRSEPTPGLWTRARSFVSENLWSREPLPAPLSWLRSVTQLGIVIAEGFAKDQLVLRAHSLTYLTVLSIVPLLALVATFASMLDVRERVLDMVLAQIAATVPEAREKLAEWAERLDFGALGPVMGAVLISTTVLALGGIEKALNAIWGVTRQRAWVRRVPDYLAVLVIAPLLLGIAIPLRASLESQWVVQRILEIPALAQAYDFGLTQAPLILVVVAFSFMYWFLPNTEVRARSALLGGVLGGVLFGVGQTLYVTLNVGFAKYNAIFGGFAAAPLFLVWVFFSWAIFLLGAEVAYAHQTLARYRREVRGAPAGPAEREAIGLAIALECGRAFRDGAAPWKVDGLSEHLDVPLRTVRDVTERLADEGLLSPCGEEAGDAFQLGRAAERVRLGDVLRALRGPRAIRFAEPDVTQQVQKALDAVDGAAAKISEDCTLADLVEALDGAPARRGGAETGSARPAVEREATSS